MPKVITGTPIAFQKSVIQTTTDSTSEFNMDTLIFNSSSDSISFLLNSPKGSKEIILDGSAYLQVASRTIPEVQKIRAEVIQAAIDAGKLPPGTMDNWSV